MPQPFKGEGSPASDSLVALDWGGRAVSVEVAWVGESAGAAAPLVVFLHEGLGSVSMWRDFPERFCRALGVRGLVWSRPGYGRSTPRLSGERWTPQFMHRQAREVLPALLAALRERGEIALGQPLVLLGHSDGGSIALLAAAAQAQGFSPLAPFPIAGLVLLAPHIFVEDISVQSIAKAREAYLGADLRARLARHHDDPDSPFWGWNDIWLAPEFRHWSIAEEIDPIACQVLAMQGLDDEYGTLEQIRGIARRVAGTRLVEIPHCGHSPHRDQPATVIDAAAAFLRQARPG